MSYNVGINRIMNDNFERNDVIRWEVLKLNSGSRIRLNFISTDSKFRQGVRLAIDNGDGVLKIDSGESKSFILWEDTCPKNLIIECYSNESNISIYNVFERNGSVESLKDYSGMILSEENNICTYSCNDTGANYAFNKLVFSIEKL